MLVCYVYILFMLNFVTKRYMESIQLNFIVAAVYFQCNPNLGKRSRKSRHCSLAGPTRGGYSRCTAPGPMRV